MYRELEAMYHALYDEKSKRNFIYRLANNLSADGRYIVQMIIENCKHVSSPNIGEYYGGGINKKRVIVYGAFTSGKTRYEFEKYLKMDEIYCFCDRDTEKQKKGFCGKKVISPEALVKDYRDCYVLIETKYYYDEVYQYLVQNGFPEANIIRHSDNGVQYFDYEYLTFSDKEIMVDAGCFDCETIKDFVDKVHGRYEAIIAFEPDLKNYNRCKEIAEREIEKATIVHAGLWDREATLGFEGDKENCSKIVESAEEVNEMIKVVAIDDYCKDMEISFIKMDIEGSELRALHGAENTIRKYKPKLAVCIYHKREDILDIQAYLMGLVPEYRFGIRHYTDHAFETVLYAFIPNEKIS